RAPAQDLVVGSEEDLGVFAVGKAGEAGVAVEVGRGPLPDAAEQVLDAVRRRAVGVRTDLVRAEPPAGLPEVGGGSVGDIGPGDGSLHRVAGARVPTRGLLPFGLGGQALAGPPSVRVGLVPAH